ncbi:hypothetical protein VDN48_001635 [Citrobacter braakii]|nr:hypothetical protein [Citrobacter braakii]
MTTITKERLQEVIDGDILFTDEQRELARIALASLEAEAVYQFIYNNPYEEGYTEWLDCNKDYFNGVPEDCRRILYTALPAPVSVPDEMEMDDDFDSAFEHGKAVGWNAYRAAMLQSFGNSEQLNSPVIPDGWVLVPVNMSPEMMRAVQINSELGAYSATNLTGAYSLFREFWDVAIAAAPQQEDE